MGGCGQTRANAVTTATISVESVSKRFGSHVALDDVSLDVSGGELVIVLGPSGCGKTTLLRTIAGLDVPDRGRILLNDRLAAQDGRSLIAPYRRRVGFVFQDLALWPHLTVRQQLEFVLEPGRYTSTERSSRVQQALDLARIQELGLRYPHQLSGGEQQRAALARALVGEPAVLLLDEPLSSLDSELRSVLRAELARLHDALHLSTVYVTHDRDEAVALGDRVVQMRAGRIIDIGINGSKENRA